MDAGGARLASGRGRWLTTIRRPRALFLPFRRLWMSDYFLDQIDRLHECCKKGIDTRIDP
jgi:hypothetical protein